MPATVEAARLPTAIRERSWIETNRPQPRSSPQDEGEQLDRRPDGKSPGEVRRFYRGHSQVEPQHEGQDPGRRDNGELRAAYEEPFESHPVREDTRNIVSVRHPPWGPPYYIATLRDTLFRHPFGDGGRGGAPPHPGTAPRRL